MESSNNNLNVLDRNEEDNGKTIDRLDMLIRYQGDCTRPSYNNQPDYNDGDNSNYYVTTNPRHPQDQNESYSETRMDDRQGSVGIDRRLSSIPKAKVIFENSYRMEPNPDEYFIWYKAKALMAAVINPLFTNFVYESKSAANLSKLICSKVLLVLRKKYDWPRYRYVCNVTIAQLRHQGLIIADRSLWNTSFDGCASLTMENKSSVLVVTLHAIYFE